MDILPKWQPKLSKRQYSSCACPAHPEPRQLQGASGSSMQLAAPAARYTRCVALT
jgi:hypothetical protein